jgi:hypothetical protein
MSASYGIIRHTGDQLVCPGDEHVPSLWRELCTCRPLHLWGTRAPTTGLVPYGNVLPAILQCLPCISYSCVADGMRRLAHAQPHESGPHPTRSPGREPHASAPTHTRAAALRCMRMAGPPGCEPPQCPRQHTTPSATHASHSGGVARCPRRLCRHWPGAEGQRACDVACTYGRSPAYLREKSRVPTGEVPRTYGRRNII